VNRTLIFISLLILAAAGWGLFTLNHFENDDNFHGKKYFKEAPAFRLTDHNGNSASLNDYRDKLVLLSWGFTKCPDICPLTLSTLRKLMNSLGEQSKEIQVLFITVDPERDTPEKLKSYVPYFHKDFIGLTGSREEIDRVVEDYGAFYFVHSDAYGRNEHDTWESYQLTHTTNISLIDEKGRMILYYPYNKWDVEGMSRDIKTLLDNRG